MKSLKKKSFVSITNSVFVFEEPLDVK